MKRFRLAVNCLCNANRFTVKAKGLFLCCAGIVADNCAINAANFLPYPSHWITVRKTRYILSSEGPRSAGVAQGPKAGKDGTGDWMHTIYYTTVDCNSLTPLLRLVAVLLYDFFLHCCAAVGKISTDTSRRAVRLLRVQSWKYSPQVSYEQAYRLPGYVGCVCIVHL